MKIELTEKELEFLTKLLPQVAVTGEDQDIVVDLKKKVAELKNANQKG